MSTKCSRGSIDTTDNTWMPRNDAGSTRLYNITLRTVVCYRNYAKCQRNISSESINDELDETRASIARYRRSDAQSRETSRDKPSD